MKLTLDSNVLIAAFISRGLCSEILEDCLKNHEMVLSNFLLEETRRLLSRKFHMAPADIEEYVRVLSLHSVLVNPTPFPKPVCRDPQDDAVLGTALAGRAPFLVSGDKDLLSLKRYRTIRILSPREA